MEKPTTKNRDSDKMRIQRNIFQMTEQGKKKKNLRELNKTEISNLPEKSSKQWSQNCSPNLSEKRIYSMKTSETKEKESQLKNLITKIKKKQHQRVSKAEEHLVIQKTGRNHLS